MFRNIEKSWPLVSILLSLAVLGSLLLLPSAARPLALAVMLVGVGMSVLFIVRRHLEGYRQGQLDRPAFAREIAVDVSGMILTMAVVIPAGGRGGQFVGRLVGEAVEGSWPGHGTQVGIVAGLIAGIAAGLVAGWLMRWLWGKLFRTRSLTPKPVAAG
jgi:F0F1-type ATP synthase assembly protein I